MKCEHCRLEMSADTTTDCTSNRAITFPDGKALPAVPYDNEYFEHDPEHRCHDCNVKLGHHHHPGCDMEKCPRCGKQMITCGCMGAHAHDSQGKGTTEEHGPALPGQLRLIRWTEGRVLWCDLTGPLGFIERFVMGMVDDPNILRQLAALKAEGMSPRDTVRILVPYLYDSPEEAEAELGQGLPCGGNLTSDLLGGQQPVRDTRDGRAS